MSVFVQIYGNTASETMEVNMKKSTWQILTILLLVLVLSGTTVYSVIRWNDVPSSRGGGRDRDKDEEDEEEEEDKKGEEKDKKEKDDEEEEEEASRGGDTGGGGDTDTGDEIEGGDGLTEEDIRNGIDTANSLMSGGNAMQMVSQYIPSDASPDPDAQNLNALLDEDGFSVDWTGPFVYTKFDGLMEAYENMGMDVPEESRQQLKESIGKEQQSTFTVWSDGTWDLEIEDGMMNWDFDEKDLMTKEEKASGVVPAELTISNLTNSGFAIERTLTDGDEGDDVYGKGDFRLYGVVCDDSQGKLLVGRWLLTLDMYSKGEHMGTAYIEGHFEGRPTED